MNDDHFWLCYTFFGNPQVFFFFFNFMYGDSFLLNNDSLINQGPFLTQPKEYEIRV